MTDLRKAAEMLMKALDDGWVERSDSVVIALRQALAQPDETETLKRCLFQMQEAAKELAQPEQKLIGWKDGEPQYVAQPEQWGDSAISDPVFLNAQRDINGAIRQLAKPEQESLSTNDHLCTLLRQVHDVLACTALPMKRKWVGLTQEDIDKSWEWAQKSSPYGVTRIETFAKSIEAKLKEKNDG